MPTGPSSSMPSAVLVGEGSLLTACGDLLLQHGHDVRGVVSRALAVRTWAHERGLATGETIADLRALLDAEPVDHLFSIANLRMLPADLFARCRLAVNFHDAVLPRDAGVHASAWAVLGRARHHGITWHVMTAEADAGDILVQRTFP
ncbi:MAG TPA: formyltransferase family protein, partial [Acidimicrobiales bacterium]|nr:formyltransferase family protein [Acidimicrobiales bacterium]